MILTGGLTYDSVDEEKRKEFFEIAKNIIPILNSEQIKEIQKVIESRGIGWSLQR